MTPTQIIILIITLPIIKIGVSDSICTRSGRKKSLLKLSRQLSIPLKDDFMDDLDRFVRQTCAEMSGGRHFRISWCKYIDHKQHQDILNAGVNPIFSILNVGTKWGEILIFHRSEETIDAFRATIGHELTHAENDVRLRPKYPLSTCPFGFHIPSLRKKAQFFSYCREIHADYGGCMKAFQGDLAKTRRSMNYKIHNIPTEDSDTHPSYEHRLQYLEMGKFDELLIERIAADVGCHDEKAINCVKQVYKDDLGKLIIS